MECFQFSTMMDQYFYHFLVVNFTYNKFSFMYGGEKFFDICKGLDRYCLPVCLCIRY